MSAENNEGRKLPFAEIAAAALRQAETLLAEWLPDGKKVGPEWKALNPTRADGKVGSFSINVETGAWGDFATPDAGKDLVSLYAYLSHHGEQGRAAVELAERFGIPLPPLEHPAGRKKAKRQAQPPAAPKVEPPPPAEKPPRTWWKPILPAPEDAGEPPKAHPNRGLPSRLFPYRDGAGRVLGYVCRFITSDGGKDDIPLVFAQHEKSGKREWRWMAFAEDGRPLYGLDRATAKPEASLLFLEGEKCADAGDAALPELACLSWPGGCNGVGKADFSSLADRQVKKALLWRDCDAKRERLTKEEKEAGVDPLSKPLLPEQKQPGTKAMVKVAEQLHAIGYAVWMLDIPKPGEKPDGWDIADAIADGWTYTTLVDFLKTKAVRWLPPDAAPAEPLSTPSEAGAGGEEKKAWIPNLIWGRDNLKACMANVYQMLAHYPEWAGVFGYNQFSLSVEKLKPPPYAGGSVGEWEANDDSRTALWLAHREPGWGFTPASDVVAEAVEVLAREHSFHPVREYFENLRWDATDRLDCVPADFLGLERTEYTVRAVKWWMMGIAKRIYEPGAKFDHCLVLMGTQGKKKSTFFSVLAGQWFGDTDLDLSHKDSMSALRGKLIYEIPELGAFARSDSLRQKSFLSRCQDEYRPVYGRREIKAPRQVGFGGTTNEDEWNKDLTGGRRFLPLLCHVDEIDEQALAAVRDQLWAEAVARVKAGERYWPTQAEQREWFDPEQMRVQQQDSMLDAVHDWAYARVSPFSIFTVLSECLKLDVSKHTRDMQTRVGMALKAFGCRRIEKRNGTIRYWYEPPKERAAGSKSGGPSQGDKEGDDVGF